MASTRYVAGLEWRPDSARPPQATLSLSQADAWNLTCGNRLARLQQESGPDVRLQLIDRAEPRTSSLLITGKHADAVEAMRIKVLRLLHQEPGQIVAVHALDIDALQRNHCELALRIEEQSGCRVVVEAPIPKAGDPDLGRKPRNVHLLGEQAAQARAIELLSLHCPHMAQYACLHMPDDELKSFSSLVRGGNIELLEKGTLARRRSPAGAAGSYPSDCVVCGDGCLTMTDLGLFFAFAVKKVSPSISEDRGFRGTTRLGVTSVPVLSPAPITLLNEPRCSWVFGRGVARHPSGDTEMVENADFDRFVEGNILGVLVTRETGALRVYQKLTPSKDWSQFVEWQAEIPEPCGTLFPLIELSGRLAEIKLLPRQAPPTMRSRTTSPAQLRGGSSRSGSVMGRSSPGASDLLGGRKTGSPNQAVRASLPPDAFSKSLGASLPPLQPPDE